MHSFSSGVSTIFMKQRRFYFHYNKPASQQAGKPILSVHFKDVCYLTESVDCRVPCQTKINKRQPRCVMAGYATDVTISTLRATIS